MRQSQFLRKALVNETIQPMSSPFIIQPIQVHRHIKIYAQHRLCFEMVPQAGAICPTTGTSHFDKASTSRNPAVRFRARDQSGQCPHIHCLIVGSLYIYQMFPQALFYSIDDKPDSNSTRC